MELNQADSYTLVICSNTWQFYGHQDLEQEAWIALVMWNNKNIGLLEWNLASGTITSLLQSVPSNY